MVVLASAVVVVASARGSEVVGKINLRVLFYYHTKRKSHSID